MRSRQTEATQGNQTKANTGKGKAAGRVASGLRVGKTTLYSIFHYNSPPRSRPKVCSGGRKLCSHARNTCTPLFIVKHLPLPLFSCPVLCRFLPFLAHFIPCPMSCPRLRSEHAPFAQSKARNLMKDCAPIASQVCPTKTLPLRVAFDLSCLVNKRALFAALWRSALALVPLS